MAAILQADRLSRATEQERPDEPDLQNNVQAADQPMGVHVILQTGLRKPRRPGSCGQVDRPAGPSPAANAQYGPPLGGAIGRSVVAGVAVDTLAEQIGVAVVARVFLDHVGDNPAQ